MGGSSCLESPGVVQPDGAQRRRDLLLQLLAHGRAAGHHRRLGDLAAGGALDSCDEGGEVRRRAAVEVPRLRLRHLRGGGNDDVGFLSSHIRRRRGLSEAGVRERGVARGAVALHEQLLPSLCRPVAGPRVDRAGDRPRRRRGHCNASTPTSVTCGSEIGRAHV